MKSLVVLLALLLALALAAGCNSGSSPAKAPVATATVAPAPSATTVPTSVPSSVPTSVRTPTVSATKAPSSSGSAVLDKMKTIRAFKADISSEVNGEVTKGKTYYSSNKMRSDVESAGVALILIADGNAKTAYMYNPKEKAALSMPYDQGVSGQTPDEMLDWEKNTVAPPKLLGEETVDGKACVIYEFTYTDETSQTWLDKATGFPVKSISTAGGEKTTTLYTNVVIGSVDESLFVLPAGTEIIDMSGLVATPTAKGGSPTPVRGTPTQISGSPTALNPTAIVGPVAAELKQSVQIPSGFKLVEDSGQAVDDGTTYVAMAAWYGNASMKDINDFYTSILAQGWKANGGVVNTKLDISFDKKNSNPVVKLRVQAEPVANISSTVLGQSDYDKWLRQTLKMAPVSGSTILVVTYTGKSTGN